MDRGIFAEIIIKYLNGKASKKEAELYESIYDSMQKPEEDWNELQLSNKEKIKDEIYRNIMFAVSQPKVSFVKRIHPLLKIAASILIILSLVFGTLIVLNEGLGKTEQKLITQIANFGERKTVFLEDSTKIILNAGSELIYFEPFQKDKREITLTGEAFFYVTKDKKRPFIVTTQNVTTTVLGTSFNIYAYKQEDIDITVSSGKVKVTYNPPDGSIAKTAILNPGEQASFSIEKSNLSKYEVDIKQFIDWKNDIIYFKENYFSDIIKKLERNYNVDIICDEADLLKKSITSVYENEELIEILEDLKFILGFHYTYLSDNEISITK